MKTILLIDDDERLGPPLAQYLLKFDLDLQCETHPARGIERLEQGGIELVILDVMLPDMDGFEVCRSIRRDSDIPIIMLTARGEVTDRVVGLELGADDYLAKPFEPRELVARIQNILRRTRTKERNQNTAEMDFGDLQIDTENHRVVKLGEAVNLTTREYQLLLYLANAPGQSFSRDEILNHLRGTDAELYSRSVDILISRLRSKLKPTDHIRTMWGSGYSFIGSRGR